VSTDAVLPGTLPPPADPAENPRICEVCVQAPVGRKLFVYRYSPDIGELSAGEAVLVPFGGRDVMGWVIRASLRPEDVVCRPDSMKEILERIKSASIGLDSIRLCERLMDIYGASLSDLLPLFLPPVCPKIIRCLERNGQESPRAAPALSETARQLAEWVDRDGGRIEIGRLKDWAKIYPPPVYYAALKELRATGLYAITTSVAHVRPAQKTVIGLGAADAGATGPHALKPENRHREVLEFLGQHPYRYGVSEVARLTGVSTRIIRDLVRRQLLTEQTRRIWHSPMESRALRISAHPAAVVHPTPSQGRAATAILDAMRAQTPDFFLLYGPTASGKTLVYEIAARHALARGRQVLLMVPEIALTKPLVDRIRKTIPDPFAVVHSRQTRAERRDEWQRCASGEARLLVGPRSAAFVPLPDLGLAIIDECHDAGYKQSESPFLDARVLVEERCRLRRVPMIYGSATPTVEQLHLATAAGGGVYRQLNLTEFPTRRENPTVRLIDLKQTRPSSPHPSQAPSGAADVQRLCRSTFLTPVLQDLIEKTLVEKEAVILLLNRRGFSPLVVCPECGFCARCEDCLMGMTYHAAGGELLCHGCGASRRPPARCPTCGYAPLGYMGAGTERIEDACRRRFPTARIGRVDGDVIRKDRRQAFAILEGLSTGEIDILIGTQMIAKGLDVPRVTLAAVLLADVGLNLPDYRNREKTFQLLAQLIGRAGRHDQKGTAVVQTFHPESPAIRHSLSGEVGRFYEEEMKMRQEAIWPPFCRLARLLVLSPNAPKALQVIRQMVDDIRGRLDPAKLPDSPLIHLTAPQIAPMAKIKGCYRFQSLIRLRPGSTLGEIIPKNGRANLTTPEMRVTLEPDPISIL